MKLFKLTRAQLTITNQAIRKPQTCCVCKKRSKLKGRCLALQPMSTDASPIMGRDVAENMELAVFCYDCGQSISMFTEELRKKAGAKR